MPVHKRFCAARAWGALARPTLCCAQVSVSLTECQKVTGSGQRAQKQSADSAPRGTTCGTLLAVWASSRSLLSQQATREPGAGALERCCHVRARTDVQDGPFSAALHNTPEVRCCLASRVWQGVPPGRPPGAGAPPRPPARPARRAPAAARPPACARAAPSARQCAPRAARRPRRWRECRASARPPLGQPASATSRRRERSTPHRESAQSVHARLEAMRGGGRRRSATGCQMRGHMRTHSVSALRPMYAARRPQAAQLRMLVIRHHRCFWRARGQLCRTSTSSPPRLQHVQR